MNASNDLAINVREWTGELEDNIVGLQGDTGAVVKLTEAQAALASMMAGGLTASMMALGEAMAIGQSGWDNWAASGLNAISLLIAKWSEMQILEGIGMLLNPFTAAAGAGKIALGLGGAGVAGALAGGAQNIRNRDENAAQRGTVVYQTVNNIGGSVIRERDMENLGVRGMARARRGY
jgi:hypothetical protein